MVAICRSRSASVETQRDDHSFRVDSMAGTLSGGRSRRGEMEEMVITWLYGSSVPVIRPA